jgi:xanthosine utilization system XapX-like protein
VTAQQSLGAFVLILGLFGISAAIGNVVEPYPLAIALGVGVGFIGLVVGGAVIQAQNKRK